MKINLSPVVDKLIINRFKKDRKSAEKIVEAAFPGCTIKRFRKDRGIKKQGGKENGRTESV